MSNKETLTVQTTTLPHDGVASEPTERSPDMVAMSALGPHLHQPLPTNIAGEVQAAVASLEALVESPGFPQYRSNPEVHGVLRGFPHVAVRPSLGCSYIPCSVGPTWRRRK